MAIYNATITRIDTNQTITLGRVANSGKMNMFRAMQAAGEEIVSLFDDCGEFEFIWNKSAKVWEFFSEGGVLVGRLKAERDSAAEHKAKLDYYEHSKAAYAAQQRAKCGC